MFLDAVAQRFALREPVCCPTGTWRTTKSLSSEILITDGQ